MIPVHLQPEPKSFDREVRQPGLQWLNKKGICPDSPPPKASDLPDYWSKTNKALWEAYSGVCAYLSIYFEWASGASSTDHFIPKSKNAGKAYEWDNYRLACLGANRNKSNFEDILDPIGLENDVFFLNPLNGEIYLNPKLQRNDKIKAQITIERLKLNNPDNNEMRARHLSEYLQNKNSQILKKLSPFVWYEAQRQGLL